MKPGEVAQKIGVTKGTILNWHGWYSEYFSTPPMPGEFRNFTDEDMRLLVYIKALSDRGLKRSAVQEALAQRQVQGTPFPPIHPDVLRDPNSETTSLALQEAQHQLSLKEAEINHLMEVVQDRERQIEAINAAHKRDVDALLDRYVEATENYTQKYTEKISTLMVELGQMRQKLSTFTEKDEQYGEERQALLQQIADQNQEIGALKERLQNAAQDWLKLNKEQQQSSNTGDE